MAATTAFRFSLLAPFLAIVILGTFYQSSSYGVAGHNIRTISSSGASGDQIHRNLLAAAAARRKSEQQLPNCGEMAGKLPCLKNSRCRWCRSEALDDMCFSKPEAFRLPSQDVIPGQIYGSSMSGERSDALIFSSEERNKMENIWS